MWLTPCSSRTSSVWSDSRFETLPRAAAPKIARDDSWPVAPKGARGIMPASLRRGVRAGRRGGRALTQHGVQPPGPERPAVEDAVAVAGGADGRGDLRFAGERLVEAVGRDLDAAHDPV